MTEFICCRSYSALIPHVGQFLRSASILAETVLLAPSRGAADDLARRCCPSGILGLHRVTWRQLAAELSTPGMVAAGMAPASRLATEAICARVAHQLRNTGRIPYFEPVASMPGFARALAATLTELRLENADPSKLRDAGAPGRDLSALLGLYEQKLNDAALADLATMLRLATAAALEGKHRFVNRALILLDPPMDTALERNFVSALVSRSPRIFAATLAGDEKAIGTLQQILGIDAVRPDTDGTAIQLDRVRASLFLPQPQEPVGEDDSLDYFSAPGEGMESVEIARRIHKLADADTPFDRIAILLRDPERYQPFLEEALRRAGIPAYFTRGVVRPHPAGRAFLALLACAQDGCSASRFGEYLSLGQVPSSGSTQEESGLPLDDELLSGFLRLPEEREPKPFAAGEIGETVDENAPVLGGALQSPIGWEDLLVDAAVIGGVERWERRLSGLKKELSVQANELDENSAARQHLDGRIRRLDNLERFAIPLVRRLHALPGNAIWSEWIAALTDLARAALRESEPVLSILSELESMGEVGPVALDEVIQALSDRLRFLRREPDPRRYGQVFVSSVDEARGRAFDIVFLPGLAEGLFPRKMMEDPLLLDAYRWPPLTVQDDRVRQERLLLHRAVAAADKRLIFSYPRVDVAQSRPRVPSLYAMEILRAAMGKLPELRDFERRAAAGAQARLDWPAPRQHQNAIDDAEYDLVSLDDALRNKRRGSVRYLVEVNAALGRSLRARAWRWKSKWSYADGLVDPDDVTRAALVQYGLATRSYSASSLQQFAICPYRFFLHTVHQLRPRETPVALEQMDPLTRGGLFHAVQRELFTELQSAGLLPVNRERLNPIRDAADRALDRVAAQYEEDLCPAIPRVWRSEVEEIRTDLHGWLSSMAATDEGWRPIHFELGFGMKPDARRDPASTPDEVIIANGVRLRGSIDLVERHEIRGTLRVIDHKTGKAPDRPPVYVGGGTALQPLLYTLATEAMLGARVESSELSYCTQRGNYQRFETAATPSARAFIGRVLEIIESSIDEGFLPAAPQQDACPLCDYRSVCGPHEAQRSKKKKPERLDSLVELRNMP